MYLFILLIGIILGANRAAIYQQTVEDTSKVLQKLRAATSVRALCLGLEQIFIVLTDRYSRPIAAHDFINPCTKRQCETCGGKPISINTYVRKLKAVR